jgi:hypothetical protein
MPRIKWQTIYRLLHTDPGGDQSIRYNLPFGPFDDVSQNSPDRFTIGRKIVQALSDLRVEKFM